MKKVNVDSYESLLKVLDERDSSIKKTFLLFTGSKDANGVSWCPDCNVADPVVKECLANYEASNNSNDTLFVTVNVGGRDAWKNPDNAFRKGKFAVKSVPTPLKYGTTMRLQEQQTADEEMVNMLLEE